jgi:hypothetical protein
MGDAAAHLACADNPDRTDFLSHRRMPPRMADFSLLRRKIKERGDFVYPALWRRLLW